MKMLATMAVLGLLGVPSLAIADDMKMDMPKGMDMTKSGSTTKVGGEADKAYKASMDTMMANMDVKPTGKPDADFVTMMMPHHQGAIDMAKVELKYGTDPTLRKMAQGIVAAQETEIAEMKAWQAKNGK